MTTTQDLDAKTYECWECGQPVLAGEEEWVRTGDRFQANAPAHKDCALDHVTVIHDDDLGD